MLKIINEAFSFLLELAMLAAFTYAGFRVGSNQLAHYLLGIGIPLLVIIFWANYMAPKAANRLRTPWLQALTLVLFEASAVALYTVGVTQWAWILGTTALINVGLKLLYK